MSVNNLASGHVVPPEMAKVVAPGPQPVVGPPPTQFRGQGIGQVEVSFQLSREKAKKFKDIAERDHSLITQLQRFGIHSIRFQGNRTSKNQILNHFLGLPSAHRPEHRVRSPYPYPHRAVPMPNQRFLYQPGNHPMQAQPNHPQNQMETDAKGTKRKKRPNVQNKIQNMPPTAQNPPVHPKAISPLVSPASHGLYAHGNPPNFHQQGAQRVHMRPPRPPMIIQRAPQLQHIRNCLEGIQQLACLSNSSHSKQYKDMYTLMLRVISSL